MSLIDHENMKDADIIGAWSFNEAMREAITEAYASLVTTR